MSDPKKALVVERIQPGVSRDEGDDPTAPAPGRWYWVRPTRYSDQDDDSEERLEKEEYLGCITYLGSNYAHIECVGGHTTRVHFEKFYARCRFEPDASSYIQQQIAETQSNIKQLMGEVQQVTARLAINVAGSITDGTDGGETKALARVSADARPIEEYKQALILAKKETLPALFEKIKEENEELAAWMTAEVIPLKAQVGELAPIVKAIEARVFNVELYAGLTEEVVRVKDGAPAPTSEKIRLFQRRHYMDEECLVNYSTGGMSFDDIDEFDAWLVKPENLERILPFQRCVVAFKVRRREKERKWGDIGSFIKFFFGREAEKDEQTFIYMRNGEQVFRLGTSIQFDEKLFPDVERSRLVGALYAKGSGFRNEWHIVNENEYLALCEADEQHRRAVAAYDEAVAQAKAKGLKRGDPGYPENAPDWHRETSDEYIAYTKDTVYYDDITAFLKSEMDKHNRVVLVLQGILDRSLVMHPHPPWQLWTPDGFNAALELVFDESRALPAGEKPDFQAYRDALNAKLTKGSITVGQDQFWALAECEKYNQRVDYRWRRDSQEYRPDGNPGPGYLAKCVAFSKTRGATFAWMRERTTRRRSRFDALTLPARITVPVEELFNVSAYTPGDFKRFFADPRTRAEYLEWAPYMLAAEEYYAGNFLVGVEPRRCRVTRTQTRAAQAAEEAEDAQRIADGWVRLPGGGWSGDNVSAAKLNEWHRRTFGNFGRFKEEEEEEADVGDGSSEDSAEDDDAGVLDEDEVGDSDDDDDTTEDT